ncbi:MAG: HAD family hydrolase [Myxococcota bacterium]|nr:HAD family hydrolase [Myxococcota bacterium]
MSKALFLDRDGVININHGYVHKKDNFEFIDGLFEVCREAMVQNFQLVMITNQAGIARGYYLEEDFQTLTLWMLEQLNTHGIEFLDYYHCPYLIGAKLPQYDRDSQNRKPNPGMLLQAQRDHDLDLSKSIIIGDSASDMLAGQKAGVSRRWLLSSGLDETGAATQQFSSHSEILKALKV